MSAGGKALRTVWLIVVLAGCLVCNVWADTGELSGSTEAGDTVYYGMYQQDTGDVDDWSDLEWRVLARDGDDVLLLSEKCIASLPYETVGQTALLDDLKEVTWESCTLREWLNDAFMMTAFSEEERAHILIATHKAENVEEDDLTEDRDVAEGDVDDRVFLLTSADARSYFTDKEDRRAKCTDLVEHGEDARIFISEETDCVFWWLRTQARERECAMVVGAEGSVVKGGFLISRMDIGVRPAIWVRIPGTAIAVRGGDRDYENRMAAAAQDAGYGEAYEDAGAAQELEQAQTEAP